MNKLVPHTCNLTPRNIRITLSDPGGNLLHCLADDFQPPHNSKNSLIVGGKLSRIHPLNKKSDLLNKHPEYQLYSR